MQIETTPTTVTEPKLEIHPLAEMLPEMDDKDYAILKHDIEAVGQQEPIVLYEAKILDGRHRYRACRELGIKPV